MKILLADCYHDSDKGGGGMIVGAVRAITDACGKAGIGPEISLLFRFSEDDPKFASANRLTGRRFPDLPALPAPISSRRGPGLHWIPWALRVGILAPLRLLLPGLSRHPAMRAMREADAIVFKGGNFYRSWSGNEVADAIATVLLFFPLLLAIRMGKRFAVVSHTFGPFHTRSSRAIAGWILARAAYVSAREATSQRILGDCGLPQSAVPVTPDFGFGASVCDDTRTQAILAEFGLNAGDFVAFTARPWFYAERGRGDEGPYRQYVTGAAAILDHAIESGAAARIALVVQNDGAHSVNEPDPAVLRDIHAAMAQADAAVIMDHDFSADELCGIYGHAALTIGTRLHSCIFPLSPARRPSPSPIRTRPRASWV